MGHISHPNNSFCFSLNVLESETPLNTPKSLHIKRRLLFWTDLKSKMDQMTNFIILGFNVSKITE